MVWHRGKKVREQGSLKAKKKDKSRKGGVVFKDGRYSFGVTVLFPLVSCRYFPVISTPLLSFLLFAFVVGVSFSWGFPLFFFDKECWTVERTDEMDGWMMNEWIGWVGLGAAVFADLIDSGGCLATWVDCSKEIRAATCGDLSSNLVLAWTVTSVLCGSTGMDSMEGVWSAA